MHHNPGTNCNVCVLQGFVKASFSLLFPCPQIFVQAARNCSVVNSILVQHIAIIPPLAFRVYHNVYYQKRKFKQVITKKSCSGLCFWMIRVCISSTVKLQCFLATRPFYMVRISPVRSWSLQNTQLFLYAWLYTNQHTFGPIPIILVHVLLFLAY